MAVTDYASAAGVQPRVWMVNFDDQLRSKKENALVGGWMNWASTVNSGLAGVSLSGTTQRERVFYRSGTTLVVRGYDGTVVVSATLPAPTGATVAGDDVAAVTWNDAGTDRIAVAARSSLGATCMWEGTFTGGFATVPYCITDATFPTDVAAAVSAGTPAFFYGATNDIVRIRRTGLNLWSRTLLAGPVGGLPAGRSLDVVPSTIGVNLFEIAVNATPPKMGRVSATGATISWTSAPALPAGLTTATDAIALSLVRYRPGGTSYDRMAVGVTAYNGASTTLLRLTTNATGTAWNATWTSSAFAATTAYPRDEMSFFGAAASAPVAFGTGTEPAFFGAAGAYAFIAYGATVQAFSDTFGWRDYVRPQYAAPRLLGYGELDPGSSTEIWASIAETVGTAETISGTATGIRRNTGTPWEVTLSATSDGASTWNDEYVMAQLPSLVGGLGVPESLTDPYLAREPGYGTVVHHLSLQIPLNSSCVEPTLNQRRLVYRTGSATAVADMNSTTSPGLTVLATGSLDHGGMAVTEDASGNVTTHFAYNDDNMAMVRYIQRSPAGVLTTTNVPGLLNQRAGISRGVGNRVYAWGFNVSGAGLFTICPVYPVFTGTCVTVSSGAVVPVTPYVRFGTGSATLGAGMNCPAVGMPALFYPCFDTAQPAIVFSKTIIDKVYIAFQGNDVASPGSPSIYYVTGDAVTGGWTTPLRVHDRPVGSTDYYIDPAVMVDADETVTVVYSAIPYPAVSATGLSRVAMKKSEESVFADTLISRDWYPEDLSIHCARNRYFLGEYIEGDSLGGRSFLTTHEHNPSYSTMQLSGFWASRWSAL
jgi:hypothetical protein